MSLISANGWAGSGSSINPYIIEGLDITGSAGACVYIGNTTAHLIIRECYLHGALYAGETYKVGAGVTLYNASNIIVRDNDLRSNSYGIYIIKSSNNRLLGNNCSGAYGNGITLKYSDHNTIEGNDCNGSGMFGISLQYSNNNTISGNFCSNDFGSGMLLEYSCDNYIASNTCEKDYQGIFLQHSCNSNVIVDNVCTQNKNSGINLYYDSCDNIVSDNFLSMNGNAGSFSHSGVHIESTHGNVIVNNTMSENVGHGVYVSQSYSTLIYGNKFLNNNAGLSQAYDSGNNFWNTSTYGNYWSDWTSPDADGDGFVDTPYSISGSAKDQYPLAIPSLPYVTLTSPADSTVTNQSTVLVTGVANPAYKLVINGLVIQVDVDGSFSAVLALLEGENDITARSGMGRIQAVDTVTTTYTDRLPALEEENANLQDRIADLEVVVDGLEGEIDGLEERAGGLEEDVGSLEDEVSSLENEVGSLEDKVGGLEDALASANGTLSSVEGDVSALQGDSLPLMLGAAGLALGLVAILVAVITRKKQ